MKAIKKHIFSFAIIALLGSPILSAQTFNRQDSRRIEQTESIRPNVKVLGTVIEFYGDNSGSVKFEVFSITGQLVRTIVVKDQPMRIELQRGCYIIKCSSWTKRVMLK